jgi:hypothetical protein
VESSFQTLVTTSYLEEVGLVGEGTTRRAPQCAACEAVILEDLIDDAQVHRESAVARTRECQVFLWKHHAGASRSDRLKWFDRRAIEQRLAHGT